MTGNKCGHEDDLKGKAGRSVVNHITIYHVDKYVEMLDSELLACYLSALYTTNFSYEIFIQPANQARLPSQLIGLVAITEDIPSVHSRSSLSWILLSLQRNGILPIFITSPTNGEILR